MLANNAAALFIYRERDNVRKGKQRKKSEINMLIKKTFLEIKII
jgi:hypothetical protein